MDFIHKYFNAERAESWLFIAIGIVALGLAFGFFFKNGELLRGVSYPLAIIALIQLTVGGTVLLRSNSDIRRVTEIVQTNPTRIKTEELPRMDIVMKNFALYRYLEIVLLLVGLCLIFYSKEGSLLKGIGIGLAIQSALILGLDYFAEQRGHEYIDKLKHLL
jgi:drug/metabolite transporter (DMT)-like permease